MVRLKCQQCGAGLEWDGLSELVRCGYCGTQYLMHPRDSRFRARTDPFVGSGRVQGIPIAPGGNLSGLCPIESYVPEGWRARAGQAPDDFYGDHAGNPFVVQAEYTSPDGAQVLFRGSNLYTDRKLSRVPLIKQIDVLGSYMRVGTPFNAEQYCDYLVQRDIAPAAGRKLRVEEADAAERTRQQTLYNSIMSQGPCQVGIDWKRVRYEITDRQGQERLVSVETRVVDTVKSAQPMMGGGLLGRFLGQMPAAGEHYWETQYEFLILADRAVFDRVFPLAQKINESIQYTPDLDRIRQPLLQHLQALKNQTAMAVHQQEMASWDRMQNTVSDTHNYTMNVMHEMNANTAATHQRVANLHSESIRGVNTYYNAQPGYGRPDVVEADVRWDHVYQNRNDPDVFLSSEIHWLEPGVDFEELRRTDGRY